MYQHQYSSTGCREELRRLAEYKGLITSHEFRTLRGQVLSGDVDAAWRGLERILKRKKGSESYGSGARISRE